MNSRYDKQHTGQKASVYDFVTPGNPKHHEVELLPCLEYMVSVPCSPSDDLNPFERVILRLAYLGITDAALLADTLCMQRERKDLLHFIQRAMAQKGLLVTNTFEPVQTDRSQGEDGGSEEVHIAKIFVEQSTGKLLPVLMEGQLPVYGKISVGNDATVSYTKGYAQVRGRVLPHGVVDTPSPSAMDVSLAFKRMRQDNRRISLPPDSRFFSFDPSANGTNRWEVHEPGTPCYVACRARYTSERGATDQWFTVQDCFGRGSDGMAGLLTALFRQNYPEVEERVLGKAVRQHESWQVGITHIHGFSDTLSRDYNLLAKALQICSTSHSTKDLVAAAYDTLEHLLSAISRRYKTPELVDQFSNRVGGNIGIVQEACGKLGLAYPATCTLFNKVTSNTVLYMLKDPRENELDSALAACLVEASQNLRHPMNPWSAQHPDFLHMLVALSPLRNDAKHTSGAGNAKRDGVIRNCAATAEACVRHFLPEYLSADDGEKEKAMDTEANARVLLLQRFSPAMRKLVQTRMPELQESILRVFSYEDAGRYDRAETELCAAYQTLLNEHRYSVAQPGSPAHTMTKEQIVYKCQATGLLPQGVGLPRSLDTVKEYFLTRALNDNSPSLGAGILAYIAHADDDTLRRAAAIPSATGSTRNLLTDVARLCTLRGHGNGNPDVTEQVYKRDVLPMLSEVYLTTITHLLN